MNIFVLMAYLQYQLIHLTTKLQLKLQDNALRNNQLLNLIQRIAFSFKIFDNWIVKLLEKHVFPSGNAFQSVGVRWLPLKTGCISVHHLLGYNLIFYFGFGCNTKTKNLHWIWRRGSTDLSDLQATPSNRCSTEVRSGFNSHNRIID